jgi:uncharacterized membrane protein
MTYSPVLIVHICGGIIGVLSGSTALVARKGSYLHRKSGVVFVISILSMAAAGAYVAFTKSQTPNVIAGAFTIYLVATAWLTVMRKENETGRVEFGLLLVGLAAGISSLTLGWESAHSATASKAGDLTALFVVVGSVALLSVAGDIRMLIRGGVSGAKRLVRHLWRMCVALFIAAGSFFLGTASDPVLRRTGLRATLFTPEIRKTHLPEVPVLIIVILTIFWLCRVWFTSAYKRKRSVAASGGLY